MVMQIQNVKFLDSLNYLHMPLSALPEAYGLGDIEKGYFPHLFNTPENQNYVGEIPEKTYYSPGSMTTKQREDFEKWYEKQREENYRFDFQIEIVKYCKQDVKILRLACLALRKTFINCGSTDPFTECSTIASACMRVYRKNWLEKDTIGIIPQGGYRSTNKQSKKAIQWLSWMENVLNAEIAHAGRSREKRLIEGPLVDGYIELNNDRIVLQFHGCFWHGCIKCYTYNRSKELEDRHTTTLKTSELIQNSGYVLIEKWECEFDQEIKNNAEMRGYVEREAKKYQDPLDPRDAFFGGRTGNIVKSYDIRTGEKIKYVDVCSLYPYICKYGRYPIGHPKLYINEDECRQLLGDGYDITNVDGLIKCEVLPPRDLFHPVLPVKMHNKLLFPLCRSCVELKSRQSCNHERPQERTFTGTWVADELKKAVELGYKITKVFEIWKYNMSQYDKRTGKGGLFHAYIDKFFIEKTHASGLPRTCTDEESINRFIEEFELEEGIKLDKNRLNFNAGLRSVAKLCLNSLWGKFGQRENMPKTEIIHEPSKFFDLICNSQTQLCSFLPINNENVYATWTYIDEAVEPSPFCNVVVAAYTTALARLRLYSELEKLGERVLYYDTDSVIYISRGCRNDYEPPTGPFLGQLTDELERKGFGTYIRSFVSGGPKFYAYEFVKPDDKVCTECKVKGLRLNSDACERINFKSIRELVLREKPPLFVVFDAIRRTSLHDVVTRNECKKCEPVYGKRWFVTNDKSYPFGFKL